MNGMFDKYPWNAVPYDPEMMAYVRLDLEEFDAINEEIRQSPDPLQRLIERLKQNAERNRAAEAVRREARQTRMEEEAATLGDPANWPVPSPIAVKWASWLVNQHNKNSFGLIYADEPLVVVNREDGSRYEYSTIEELVQTWAID